MLIAQHILFMPNRSFKTDSLKPAFFILLLLKYRYSWDEAGGAGWVACPKESHIFGLATFTVIFTTILIVKPTRKNQRTGGWDIKLVMIRADLLLTRREFALLKDHITTTNIAWRDIALLCTDIMDSLRRPGTRERYVLVGFCHCMEVTILFPLFQVKPFVCMLWGQRCWCVRGHLRC